MKVENNGRKPSSSNSQILPNCNPKNVRTIRVLIVDDQNFVCQRLKALLEPKADLKVIGTAQNGAVAINLIESLEPDVVLLDLEMPVIDGFEAIEIILKRFPECKVLVLSSHDDDDHLNRALQAGAKGYLLKTASAEELVGAIHSANSSYFQLSPGLFEKVAQRNSQSDLDTDTTSKESSKNSSKQSDSPAQESSAAPEQNTELFRQKSLERLSSPEQLDQLMKIVHSKSWIPLATLGFIGIMALVWGIFGRIPITVEGAGVLIHPSTVVPVQAKGSGQLIDLKVKNGEVVTKGEVIATIDQSDRQKELARAQAKLAQLQNQNSEASSVQVESSDRKLLALQQQRQSLQQRLQIIEDMTPDLKEKGLLAIQSQRQTSQQRLQNLVDLAPTFKKRFETRQSLYEKGAISEDNLLEARQQYSDNLSSIDEAKDRLKDLDVQEAEALQQYLTNINEIKDIQAQIQDLDSEKANLTQQDLENTTVRQKEIQEAKREIAQIRQEINSGSQIVSKHSGRIIEFTVNPGEVVDAGTRVASINTNNGTKNLVGMTYFPVKDGKKVQPGMKVQVTPQTVKRERFGGIVGTVENVASFPSTTEAAGKVVGNPQIISGLVTQAEPVVIQISTSLEPDSETVSGYKWSSSSGPSLKISAGTTTSVRVKVEDRSPISFVFPVLRSVSGIY